MNKRESWQEIEWASHSYGTILLCCSNGNKAWSISHNLELLELALILSLCFVNRINANDERIINPVDLMQKLSLFRFYVPHILRQLC